MQSETEVARVVAVREGSRVCPACHELVLADGTEWPVEADIGWGPEGRVKTRLVMHAACGDAVRAALGPTGKGGYSMSPEMTDRLGLPPFPKPRVVPSQRARLGRADDAPT